MLQFLYCNCGDIGGMYHCRGLRDETRFGGRAIADVESDGESDCRTAACRNGVRRIPGGIRGGARRVFRNRNATDREKRVAGCPEYAFNEYLQIGLEQGSEG